MKDGSVLIASFVSDWGTSPFAPVDQAPWQVTQNAQALVKVALAELSDGYDFEGNIAVHESAQVETGAVLKGPLIVGPRCFIASAAYVRGGAYLASDCIIGPGSELKSSFLFRGSKLAHFNFVGDSILRSHVNVEAGAVVANCRNELSDKQIRIRSENGTIDTGVEKFGALIGDNSRIGANAVIAPGALLKPGTAIGRLELVDQSPAW